MNHIEEVVSLKSQLAECIAKREAVEKELDDVRQVERQARKSLDRIASGQDDLTKLLRAEKEAAEAERNTYRNKLWDARGLFWNITEHKGVDEEVSCLANLGMVTTHPDTIGGPNCPICGKDRPHRHDDLSWAREKLANAEAERDRLKAELEKYGRHLNTCAARDGMTKGECPCSCGFATLSEEHR